MQQHKLPYHDEKSMIAGCLAGKHEAQAMLYKMLSSKNVFSVCLRYAQEVSDHTAEDLLQEGFLKVFKNLRKVQRRWFFRGLVKKNHE
jgi:RNA polymerase sigma-70 factor (ECF subfamily)